MRYEKTVVGSFLSRPNRFIAYVSVNGETVVCHVKNTGRCKELLTDGATVFLEAAQNQNRKTPYDLIAVYKGDKLINMDSQAPNRAMGEWLAASGYFGNVTSLIPEYRYCDSRLDFYLENSNGERIFVEVKGVTLERDGVVSFPDAPTERGIKHLRELAHAVEEGYRACVFFVIQMEDCAYFTPNRATHLAFAEALAEAKHSGVEIYAVNCFVSENEMRIREFVEVRL